MAAFRAACASETRRDQKQFQNRGLVRRGGRLIQISRHALASGSFVRF